MKFKKLVRVLQEYSPNTTYKDRPLLYWALSSPSCTALLLQCGADPNICICLSEDLKVSPLYAHTHGLRNSKNQDKNDLIYDILMYYNAESIRYSDFCAVNIFDEISNEIIL